MLNTSNLVEYPSEYEEYGNYTELDEEYYDDYYDYDSVDVFEFPPMVNCTCLRTDSKHELQYRKREVIKEGTIGGVPCGNVKETRSCTCLNFKVSMP